MARRKLREAPARRYFESPGRDMVAKKTLRHRRPPNRGCWVSMPTRSSRRNCKQKFGRSLVIRLELENLPLLVFRGAPGIADDGSATATGTRIGRSASGVRKKLFGQAWNLMPS